MQAYSWTTHPEAQSLVDRLVADVLSEGGRAADLADRLASSTSTRLGDWLDHVAGPVEEADLRTAGFEPWSGTDAVWRHPGAQLPAVRPSAGRGVGLRVDDATAFVAVERTGRVTGSPLSGLRIGLVGDPDEPVTVAGVERRSWACGMRPQEWSDAEVGVAARARELWACRPRGHEVAAGLDEARRRAVRMVDLVGPDLAASYAMAEERVYWQRRNTAAALQHARQDRLGLGWGNNDHHTFRSSRAAFRGLIEVLETLGFALRERFYAGAEAGWGAQVLEHHGAGLVVFADVDLSPDEIEVDFASRELADSDELGTVGLWCALHGESVLAAGMHHLEGQFDFDRLRDDLAALGIGQMAPFSDLPHLRQAFTQPERWPVDRSRLEPLVASGRLDRATADRFASEGAAGSHLENLARRDGFKGFNQANVSVTMRATDPRLLGSPTG
jgi:hypothetical protein